MMLACAAPPQRLVSVDQVVDRGALLQRRFFHQADQHIGMNLRFNGNLRALSRHKAIEQRDQLHAVPDNFAIDLSPLQHATIGSGR